MSTFSDINTEYVLLRDAVIGTLADGLSSIYAGFVVFSILGFMAKDAGLTMEQVSESGNIITVEPHLSGLFTYPDYAHIRSIHLSGHLFGNQYACLSRK